MFGLKERQNWGGLMRWRMVVVAIPLFLLLFALAAYGAASSTLPPPSDDARTLSGMWEYRLGDSPRRQGAPPDWIIEKRGAWHRVASIDKIDLRSGQTVWIRTVVPAGNWEIPSLMVVSSRSIFEVYLGTRYLFANAAADQGVRGVAGNNWEIVPLPEGSSGQYLYFRVRAVGFGAEMSSVAIGAKVRHLSTVIGASLPRFVISTALLVIGVVALALSFVGRSSRATIPLSALAIAGALYVLTGAPVRLQLYRSSAVWDFFEVGSLLFIPVGFCAFMAHFFDDKSRAYFRRAWQAHLALALVCLILGGTGAMAMRYVIPVFDLALLVNALGSGYLLTMAFMQQGGSTRLLLSGAAILFAGMMIDLFVGSLPELYLAPVPQVGHIALAACLLLFSYSLLRDALAASDKVSSEKERFELAYGAVLDMTGSHSVLRSASSAAEVMVRLLHVGRECTVRLFVKNEILSDSDCAFSSATLVSQGRLVENPALADLKQKHEAFADSLLARNALLVTENKMLVVPIVVNERRWGFLTLDLYECSAPHPDDVTFIRLVGKGLSGSLQGVYYTEETWKKAHALSEKALTESLQQLLLPRVIELPYAQAVSNYSAAESTGGDWFGYYVHEKTNCVDFFVGDVTGHGVQSALLAGVASGAVYSHEFTMSQDKFLCELVASERILRLARAVNRAIYEAGHQKLFMSMLFVSVNLETGEGWYMNCGHHGFYWIQNHANKTMGMMPTQGNALGYSLTQELTVEKFKLNQGDLLFLYSAGLTGNEGPEERKLGVRKLKAILDKSRDPFELQGFVLDAARQIWQGEPAQDDVTTVVFKWLGAARTSENTLAQTVFTEDSSPKNQPA